MKIVQSIVSVCLFAIGSSAMAQVKIGVISSATGPLASVGILQRNSAALLPRKIGDLTIEYIVRDDATETNVSVAEAKKFIDQQVDAIIGPSGSGNALAVLPFTAAAEVPLLAPVGSAAVVSPMDAQRRWVFKTTQNDEVIASALMEHMTRTKVKSLGLFASNDPFGENWVRVMQELATKAGIRIAGVERYVRTDTTVNAQALKLMSAAPDAVLVAAGGSPGVLPQTTMYDLGYKGRVYQTHGIALPDFLKLGGRKVEGTILAASLMLVIDEMPDSVASKKVAASYMADYERIHGAKAGTFGANVYDAGLLLERAIPIAAQKGKPGTKEFRAALRDALEGTRELVGTQGVFNMTAQDHSGFDQRGRVLITVKNGNWALLK